MSTKKPSDTTFVHASQLDPQLSAVVPPIYRATTYHQTNPWAPSSFDYARSGNPTREALETAMATIEGGVRGFAFASGMAALTATFLLLSAGDHLLVTRDCQGGTQRVLRGVFSRFNIAVTYVDTDQVEDLDRAIEPNTRAILVENFSNPFLHVAHVPAIVDWAHRHQLSVWIDNTFVTPYLQNPLTMGADLVLHSGTKMIGGHSDVTAGLAVARTQELAQQLYFIQNACGPILSPDDSYLVHRGLRTLPVRMRQASQTAMALALALTSHPAVSQVFYPGLPSHPGHAVANETMATDKGFGQMVTFRLKDVASVPRLAERLHFARIGAGLGGAETIVSLPELHCHAALTQEERNERQITSDVVRVSVGLEDPTDVVAEFLNALQN
ncbi:MAG: PLP-dependent aspartate aminotransferase family protein [Firmicutes bacterium]|nr:PLP-dependent aspartate aminotransferase family protein [Bacillota bacterium]